MKGSEKMIIIEKINHLIINFFRKNYRKIKRKGLNNIDITILCNNCVGGIIYHDMGLRFLSPTINLFFSEEDFLTFVEHLTDFKDAELVEIYDENYDYPIGKLISNKADISVRINFRHYKSFDEARDKWFERSARIDYDNVYVIFERPQLSADSLKRFYALDYKHKVLVTSKETVKSSNAQTAVLDVYDNNYYPGKVLEYPTTHSIKRYLDSFDYIKFLNS